MSAHPAHCRACHGTGYRPGPPIVENVQGRHTEYPTLTPCTHDHWNDDDGYDPHRDDLLNERDPKAIAERDRRYTHGQHELWQLSGGQLGKPLTNTQPGDAA